MNKYDNPKYDDCRIWVQKKREKGEEWDHILLACKNDENDLSRFLERKTEEDDWPVLSSAAWKELVEEIKDFEAKQQTFHPLGSDGAIYDPKQDNALMVPRNERSCWQMYKNKLGWNEDSLKELEYATLGILRRLSDNTQEIGPRKGLVVGHVQSGKTANMEALMAMAADHGWNFFIILSGAIENLRKQTLGRMVGDLSSNGGNLVWISVDHPSKQSPQGQRAVDFNWKPNAQQRYFTVCLKNTSRLKKLLDWINEDTASHNLMKILIIDDEADQGSISNTATPSNEEVKERRGINKLIVQLVSDVHYRTENTKGKSKCINYVMYTATPYANFLNECSAESLYPKDFIWALNPSPEYIGAEQIFGLPNNEDKDGIDIVREVSDNDLDTITDIYLDNINTIPKTLEDAICWFICSTSTMRYWGYKKPISMLVHTSQKQDCHRSIADAISRWFQVNNANDIIEKCKNVFNYEINRLPKTKWIKEIQNYGFPNIEIKDYPQFDTILNYIKELLSVTLTHIKLSDEGDLVYSKGIHLVIDNCSFSGIHGEDHVRLAYPDPNMDNYPSPAPAFIVVGGSTLSRGLTIEGLVSTFFLRSSSQCDSLMQMGRWFGYRKGYELLPRIWMTDDTKKKFEFLSELEDELREDLKGYMVGTVSPIEYGPRILASPKTSWLKLTSKNHSRNMVQAEMDYRGAKPQTVIFDRNKEIQENNIHIVEDFIKGLEGTPQISSNNSGLFWTEISINYILDNLLINKFSFSSRNRVFNEIETFTEWIKQVLDEQHIDKWTVVVAGKDKINRNQTDCDTYWNVSGYSLEKVNRSKRVSKDETSIDIGALRSLRDLVADVPKPIVDKYAKLHGIKKQSDVDNIRREAGVSKIPLLVLYRINKDSKVQKDHDPTKRQDLNAKCDVMGIQICIPGELTSKNFCKKVTINLPNKDKEEEVEDKA